MPSLFLPSQRCEMKPASECMNVWTGASRDKQPLEHILQCINIITESQHRNVKIKQQSLWPFFLDWRTVTGCLKETESSNLAIIHNVSVKGFHKTKLYLYRAALCYLSKPPELVREDKVMAYFSITSGHYSAQSFMVCLGSSPAPPKGKCSAFKRTIPEMVRSIFPDLTCLNDLLKMVQNTVIPGKARSHSFPGHCWKY